MPLLLQILAEVIWFFLPAAVANMAPVLVAWLPVLARPLDGGGTWRGRRLLGDNKTIRGLVAGVLFGSITAIIQYYFQTVPSVSAIVLAAPASVVVAAAGGALLGFGALLGDAVKSFVKRQLDVAPGQPWRPFDQIDFVLGALLLTYWWRPLPLYHICLAIILFGGGSFLISYVGVQLKMKKTI